VANDAAGAYEAPELVEYGTIEEWTQGTFAQTIKVSIVL
jgi:hypothetical protein